MSGPQHPASERPVATTAWHVDQAPDPGWAAPEPFRSWAPEPAGGDERRRPSRWLTLGVPVLAVILIVAVVAALGGFAKRTDRLITVAAGQPISTGPLTYTFDRATSVQKDSLGKTVNEVVVYGHAQTSGDESMAPSSGQFAGRDDVDKTVQNPENLAIGTAQSYATGSSLTPGLPPVDFRIEFEFPPTWSPSATFRVGVADLKYQQLFFGSEDPHWEPDGSLAYQVRVPMQVLAPEK